ncbi:MAG: Twitching motility protein PilT, partial [uncultured Solirubrobacteraceae bacterium]
MVVFDAEAALRLLATTGGSDLHLKVPSPPLIRRDGSLVAVDGAPPLTNDDTEAAVRALLSDEKKLAEWHETGEVDFAYGIENL